MADNDYGGYGGGGYEAGYGGYDTSSGEASGQGLSIGGGSVGLNAPGNFGPSYETVGAGSYGPLGANYDFSAPGGLGLSLENSGLGLSPEGSYGLQGNFEEFGNSPLADYSIGNPSTSTATLEQPSTWDNIIGLLKNPAIRTAITMAVPALRAPMAIANLAMASQTPKGAASAFGGRAGAILGGAIAGQPGAILGGLAGQYAGGKSGGLTGYTGERGPTGSPGEIGMDLGGIAGGLAGLYSANQAAKAYGQQASTLGDLYGQNSPYAQALRQQLERKDAAAGRRSQYGPREVELQARLAQLYSQNAPATMQAQQMAQAQRNARLNTLLGLGKTTGAFKWAQNKLGDLWGNTGSPVDMTGFQTPMETPSYTNFAAENYAPSNFSELGTGTSGGNDFFLNY